MPPPVQTSFSFHPRLWLSYLAYAAIKLLIQLPYDWQLMIARLAGRLFFAFPGYRKTITCTNISLCFPELSQDQQQQLARDSYEFMAMALVDTAINWWGNADKIKPQIDVTGFEYVQQAQHEQKNILFFSAHFTSLESAGRYLADKFDFATSFQYLRNPFFNHKMLQARHKYYFRSIERNDLRGMIRSLKSGIPLWIASDQDLGAAKSVFAPFFGIPAATQIGPVKLARMTQAVIIPTFTRRINGRLAVEFLAPMENINDPETAATRFNQLIEDKIRETPAQYLWSHRRFKTRPEGKSKLYPPKLRRFKKLKQQPYPDTSGD